MEVLQRKQIFELKHYLVDKAAFLSGKISKVIVDYMTKIFTFGSIR